MKKFLLVLAVLFVANLGCKKMDEDNGGGICACSPVRTGPDLALVIKNSSGTDLLDPGQSGAYTANQIKVFYKDNNGADKQVNIGIRPTFTYGAEKFNYYTLLLSEAAALARQNITFYLKLGDAAPYELLVELDSTKSKIEKLKIDQQDMPMDNGSVKQYINIFYFTK